MGTKQKNVLVVDDDEILRNGMRLILEGGGHKVDEACDGKEALEALTEGTFDLIISDFEMPEMDGVQLLGLVKATGKTSFILLSELSTALQARQAYQLGADEFLNKPFNKVDFVKVVDSALGKTDGVAKHDETEYVQVPLIEFVTGTTLTVDLFIRIAADKYLKIGNKGGSLAQARVEGYIQKGLAWFYMRKQDFATYVGFNVALAQRAHSEARIECARKIRLTMHVTETLIAQLRRAGLDRKQLEDTSNVVMNAVELVMSSDDTLKLLESMEVSGTLPAHSIAVGIWACLIAKQLGWEGQSTFFKVTICALFHDVGNKEIDDPLFQKQRFELTRQEVKLVEGHTIRGRDILQSIPGMLSDAAIVAAQHHENYRGGGYPYGLKQHQIHPLAGLIGLADRLCESLKFSGQEAGIEAAFNQVSQNKRDFDNEYFRALTELVANAKTRSAA